MILLLLAGLLAFPDATVSAAADGALLWWTRVFPSLLPYLILTDLALRAAPRLPSCGRIHPIALLSFLLGALGGYPIGARVLGDSLQAGTVSRENAQRFSYAAGLMSPAFLISFTGLGLFQNARSLLPLCLSVYTVALGAFFLFGRKAQPFSASTVSHTPTVDDLFDAIANGVNAILRIGGCIILARVLAALFGSLGLPRLLARTLSVSEDLIESVLLGLMEMTGGCARAAALPLPLNVRLSLCVFFQLFGGASVLLQTRGMLRFASMGRYLLVRLCMAIAAALLCGLLCAIFLPDAAVETMTAPTRALARIESALLLLFPCALGLLSAFFFSVLCAPRGG